MTWLLLFAIVLLTYLVLSALAGGSRTIDAAQFTTTQHDVRPPVDWPPVADCCPAHRAIKAGRR